MSRILPTQRFQAWRERLERFSTRGSQTVAEFCQAEGVSVASLYQWKRRVDLPADRSHHAQQGRSDSNALFKAKAKADAKGTRRSRQAKAQVSEPGFAQLMVVGGPSGGAVIVLPQEIRIELGSVPQINAAIVREVLQYVCRAASPDQTTPARRGARC